jgi:hypothetical protein
MTNDPVPRVAAAEAPVAPDEKKNSPRIDKKWQRPCWRCPAFHRLLSSDQQFLPAS